ncbi:MAG: tryptophan synthase subunit alpha [Patescibacteria group bacterium]
MNPIDKKLEEIKKRGTVGLMTHVVVGYPNLKMTVEIVKTMAKAGADFVELQIPFSDPLADGPTIMKACEKSLEQGTKVSDAFIVAKKLSREVSVPLLFMAYFNTVFVYGVEKFCTEAKVAGISGLIVPDMPLEEESREHLEGYAKKNGLYLLSVVAPVSTKDRLQKNALVARGFVYCSARQGITGAKKSLDPNLTKYLKTVRRFFKIPVAVGFGISRREQVDVIAAYADVVVVGSAIIDLIHKSDSKKVLTNVEHFVRELCVKK